MRHGCMVMGWHGMDVLDHIGSYWIILDHTQDIEGIKLAVGFSSVMYICKYTYIHIYIWYILCIIIIIVLYI